MPKTQHHKKNVTYNEGFNTTRPSKNENHPPVKTSEKFGKTEIKKITKILIGQIHVCRLLYKILATTNKSKKNGILAQTLESEQKILMKCYCNIMVKILDRLSNYISNNFLHLPSQHTLIYVESGEYKKLKKVCEDYKRKYEKSEELKSLWKEAIEPNHQQSIKETTKMIGSLWPLVKDHNQL